MGKLNIAHHKSYHPYRRDNIERVRRDEEEARRKEAVEEGRMMLADSEARMDLLRQRAGLGSGSGSKKSAKRDDMAALDAALAGGAGPSAGAQEAEAAPAVSTLTAANGHINFFEDLERQVVPVYGSAARAGRSGSGKEKGGREAREDERGVALAPSAKDLKPWYVAGSEGKDAEQETDEQKRRRDAQRKSAHDPLTAINSQLAARSSGASGGAGSSTSFRGPGHRQRHQDRTSAASSSLTKPAAQADPESARLARESAERQRARELIERKRREREAAMRGSETPSTVRGAERGRDGGGGYGDVFNRREVNEVRRDRERRFGRR